MTHSITWQPREGRIDFRSRFDRAGRKSWITGRERSGVDMMTGRFEIERVLDVGEIVGYRIDGGPWKRFGVLTDEVAELTIAP